MADTKMKGNIAEARIVSDLLSKGYGVSIPFGEDQPYDLIADVSGLLLKIQVKYTESKGEFVKAVLRCSNNWGITVYTAKTVDVLAVFDNTTKNCYYIDSSVFDGKTASMHLRLTDTKNGQSKGVHYAKDFVKFPR